MNWHLVPLAASAPTPWRNGGGSTRELLAWPAATGWRVRVSVAEVSEDGPFSSFPGVERWFAVLDGEGVMLRMGEATHAVLRDSAPFRFDGAAAVACALPAGPTRDFNLMAPPGRATLRRVRGTQRVTVSPGMLVGLYAHHASACITDGERAQDVPAATLSWCVAGAGTLLQVEAGDALWLEVTP